MIKPNFFIIGAPKCGTSALRSYLKDHKNVFFSPNKEPAFFDIDLKKASPMDISQYLQLFSGADQNIHRAIGESSTSYLFSEKAVIEIMKFNPKAKFIVMLRNPVDLVQSWHSQLIKGAEPILDFEKAWRVQDERKKGKKLPVFCIEPKYLHYSKWGMLGEQIERLFQNVDKKRVKVILFDDFVSNTRLIYEEVLDFLEIPSDNRIDFPKVNENKNIRFFWVQRAINSLTRLWLKSKGILGITWKPGLKMKFLSLNSINAHRKDVSEVFRAELIEFFHKDLLKLSKLLGRDLSRWMPRDQNKPDFKRIKKRIKKGGSKNDETEFK